MWTTIFLNHFGINVTGLAVFLAIVGLAISLAGRDVLADIFAGALILLDHPYRIGDRVGYRGMAAFAMGQTALGVEQFLQMFFVAIAIGVGLLVGNTIVEPRNAL